LDELLLDLFPGLLVKFVDGGTNGLELSLLTATQLNHGVQELPVVDFEHEVAYSQFADDLSHYLHDFCVWDHEAISSSNIEIALVELSESALVHLRVVSSVNFGDVESFDAGKVLVRNISSEWDSQIVSERQ
jgi:hypothetical protein